MGRARRWGPVVAWAALIALLSSGSFSSQRTGSVILPVLAALLPGVSPPTLALVHEGIRKLAHLGEYLVLSLLLTRALADGRAWTPRIGALAVLLAGLYAATDELHQALVPGRGASALDALVDTAGALAGQALLAALRRR